MDCFNAALVLPRAVSALFSPYGRRQQQKHGIKLKTHNCAIQRKCQDYTFLSFSPSLHLAVLYLTANSCEIHTLKNKGAYTFLQAMTEEPFLVPQRTSLRHRFITFVHHNEAFVKQKQPFFMEPFRFFYREAALFLREFGIVRKVKKLQLLFFYFYILCQKWTSI